MRTIIELHIQAHAKRNINNLRRSVVTVYVYRVDYAVIRLESRIWFSYFPLSFGEQSKAKGKAEQSKAKQSKAKESERQGFLPVRRCTSSDLMAPLLLTLLNFELQVFFLSMWLDVTSLANLDAALTSHDCRPYWMMLLHSLRSAGIDEWGHSFASLMWFTRRGICARSIQMKVDGWRVRGCDLLLLETIDLVHLGLDSCLNITDQCLLNIVHRCR